MRKRFSPQLWVAALLLAAPPILARDTGSTTPSKPGFSATEGKVSLSRLESVADAIGHALSTVPQCVGFAEKGSSPLCSYEAFCKKIAVNAGSGYLYVNENGERVPNLSLFANGSQVSDAIKINKRWGNGSVKRAKLAFQKVVDRAHQQDEVDRVSKTILEIAKEPGTPELPSELTGEMVLKYIMEAEVRAGVKLADEVRQAWARLTVASAAADKMEIVGERSLNQALDRDPLIFPGKLEKASDEERTRYDEGARRVEKIFDEVKEELRSYLDSRKDGTNDYEIENIKRRIASIKLNMPPIGSDAMKQLCETPNASYSYQTHRFTLCPQVTEFPAGTIFFVIAHELSHSFDPCRINYSLYRVEDRKNLKPQEAGAAQTFGDTPIKPENELWYENGAAEKPDAPQEHVEAAMIVTEKNPFLSTLKCLKAPDAVGVRWPVDDQPRGRAGCAEPDQPGEGKSQIAETFADKIAWELEARRIVEMPQSRRARAVFETASLFLPWCPEIQAKAQELATQEPKKDCPKCVEAAAKTRSVVKNMDDEHPSATVRVDRILLANPEIRRAAGCPAAGGAKYCE